MQLASKSSSAFTPKALVCTGEILKSAALISQTFVSASIWIAFTNDYTETSV